MKWEIIPQITKAMEDRDYSNRARAVKTCKNPGGEDPRLLQEVGDLSCPQRYGRKKAHQKIENPDPRIGVLKD